MNCCAAPRARSLRSLGAAATGTVCPNVLPPLRQRGGNGHSVIWEKGEGDEKRQVRGRGEEKRRDKMRAATGADTNLVFVGVG